MLPNELILDIFKHIPTKSLLSVTSLVSRTWYCLSKFELKRRHNIVLRCDGELYNDEDWKRACDIHDEVNRFYFTLFKKDADLWRAFEIMSKSCSDVSSLILKGCNLTSSKVVWLETFSTLVSITIERCKAPILLWEQLSLMTSLTSLIIPDVPTGFLPLILQNKRGVTHLEVGEIPNQVIYLICSKFADSLKSFLFHGGSATYSGIASILKCKNSLQELKIQDPKYLTKYSLRLVTKLSNLKTLHLFWQGRFLINNPWSFDFCMDRHEQRVECLFSGGGELNQLEQIDLSAFYQTVDNNLIQLLAQNHLSSQSRTKHHLKRICLAHCYQLKDSGIQWLVGSRHSTGLTHLDLSGTDITGNSFLRPLPSLCSLILNGCNFLSTSGLSCISLTCPNLVQLSLRNCKQIDDQALGEALAKLTSLEVLNVPYTRISGKAFSKLQLDTRIRILQLDNCSNVCDDGIKLILSKCPLLTKLHCSVTRVTGTSFSSSNVIRVLSVNFCRKLAEANFCPAHLPNLQKLYCFGNHEQGFHGEWAQYMLQMIPNLKHVEVSNDDTSEQEIHDFARSHKLHLNNWTLTRRKLACGNRLMFSQFPLQSWQ